MRWLRVLVLVGLLSPACDRSSSATIGLPTAAPQAAATTATPEPLPTTAGGPKGVRATVVRVVDGDTVVLTGIAVGELDRRTRGRKARLIGVDTPEVYGGAECLGREASAFTRRELEDKEVIVAFDIDPVDRFGRALVYVWSIDGVFFNERIVEQGFAAPMTVPPNVKYADLFVAASRAARAHGRGLWSSC